MARINRRALVALALLLTTATVVSVAWAGPAAKPTPRFEIYALYNDQKCLDNSSPPYDFGPKSKQVIMNFHCKNVGTAAAKDTTFQFAGSQAGPQASNVNIFASGASVPSTLNAGSSFFFTVVFTPRESDPSGTQYGGTPDLARMVVSARNASTLEWVLMGSKE